ncbi:phage/plasmid primase, P4 family [Raoultibacter timonensis]|nr:phage/plasmid primase, P4 family [Raoultibacter timonensis]
MPQTMLDAALVYQKLGFAVHPLWPKSKKPATRHGFKDATNDVAKIERMWAKPDKNIGMATGAASGGIAIIDIDKDDDEGYDGMDFVAQWEREHGELPETVSAITGRGGSHLFYRVDRSIGSWSNDELHIDIRCDGGYAMLPPSVHPNGRCYEWENHPDDYAIADADENVYALIEATRKRDRDEGEPFELPEKIGKGARDETLFKYACSLQSQGVEDAEIFERVHGANVTRCDPPLPVDEVTKKVRSALGYDKGNGKPKEAEAKKQPASQGFNHARFAERLMAENHMCYIDGAPAVWNGTCYEVGRRAVEKAMIGLRKGIKDRERREVMKYLEICAPRTEMADKKYIAFANCVLNIETMETCAMSPELKIANIIPHRWNPEASDDDVDTALGNIACGDLPVYFNLIETIGLCMYRGTELAVCPIFLGKGSNGKSTYLNMIHRLIGDDNVSSLDIATIGERFQTVPLMGKLANLGDDISNEFINGTKASVIKKIVTGDYVQAEYKGGDTFKFKPYCTLVFTGNEMPRLGDNSYGMMRRLHPIPLNADFSKADSGFNPNIGRKLMTEQAMERAILLGIEGLRSCIERCDMSENEQSKIELERIKLENSSVYSWAHDEYGVGTKNEQSIDGVVIEEAHDAYKKYCADAGFMAVNRSSFTRQANIIFNVASSTARAEFADGSKVVRVFRKKQNL